MTTRRRDTTPARLAASGSPQRLAWLNANPLRAWRAAHEHTREHVKTLLGSPMPTLRDWETGQSTPSSAAMTLLAGMMQFSTDELREAWERWMRSKP